MHDRKLLLAAVPALALMLATAVASAQAPPPSTPPPTAPGTAVEPEAKKTPSFIKAYKFRPYLYWGAALGLNILPVKNTLCPGQVTCVGSPVGFGFQLDMGARFHHLIALELLYDAYFFLKAEDYYNNATWQSIRLDAHIYFLAGANIEIFGIVGGGVNFFGDKFHVEAKGGGFVVGAGIDFVPAKSFSVGAQLLYRGAVFGSYDPNFEDPDTGADLGSVNRKYMHGVVFQVNLQFRYVII